MTKMLYDKGNYIGMKNEMGKIHWSKAFRDCEQNVEEQYRIFLRKLNKLEKKYIPTRHYSGPSKKEKYATPLDKVVREDIRLKHRMWARYMRKRDEESHLAYTKQ